VIRAEFLALCDPTSITVVVVLATVVIRAEFLALCDGVSVINGDGSDSCCDTRRVFSPLR